MTRRLSTLPDEPLDPEGAGHSRRVRRIALALGRELGLAEAELAALGRAALLHDIGKLAVPREILLKPASLSEAEWRVMRGHSVEGAVLVDALGSPRGAVAAVRHHHERFDGTGYPDGLAGERIPLAARIIHVADALDSMLSTRIYRRGRPARAALAEIRRESGAQFCPACVEALVRAAASGALADAGLPPAAAVAAAA